jgi:hypothetical protein
VIGTDMTLSETSYCTMYRSLPARGRKPASFNFEGDET